MDALNLSETSFIRNVLLRDLIGYGFSVRFARGRGNGGGGLGIPSKYCEIISNSVNLLDWSLVYCWSRNIGLLDDDPTVMWMMMPVRVVAMVMSRRAKK